VLIIVVLGIPRGVVPALQSLWAAAERRARGRAGSGQGARRMLGASKRERS